MSPSGATLDAPSARPYAIRLFHNDVCVPDLLESLQEVLGTRYQLEGELGVGGMATVYRAIDLKLGRPVAIKVLLPEFAAAMGGERFRREIAVAAALSHPNIVPVFDSGGRGDLLFYVMPLIGGETLRARLEREAQLPINDAIAIARDVAQALDHAHARGIVHRDIKPENILLLDGKALVADFGIARAVGEAGGTRLTERGLGIGTPSYMSPEQCGGLDQIDGRSDLYALGCVLFEMLAGDPPFKGRTSQAIFARHMQESPPSLQIQRATVPMALQQVVEKALAKSPADRHTTAKQFGDAIVDALARPPFGNAVRRRRLHLWAAAAITVAVAAVLLNVPRAGGSMLDRDVVMGFPLRVQGAVPREAGLQVAFAVGNAFPYAEPLRWTDPWPYLDSAGRSDASRVDAATARRIARRRGAGFYVLGAIDQVRDSSIVRLELYDTGSDSLVARVVAAGPLSVPHAVLGLRAANALLPRLVGRSTHIDDAWLANRHPAAVASWLKGEVEYRHARYDEALAHYQQALSEDSSLTVAAIKGAMAATWVQEYPLGDQLVRLALRHERLLPARSVRLARGLSFLFAGIGDSAYTWLQRTVEADADWSEGWYSLGEVYLHLLPGLPALDSLAEQAFLRSMRLDSAFAPALFHLAQLAIRRGAFRDGERLVSAYRRASIDSVRGSGIAAMLACTRDGPQAGDFAHVARLGVEAANEAGLLLAAGARWPECARKAFTATLGTPGISDAQRWAAVSGLHHLAIAAGQTALAIALIDSLIAEGHRWPQALLILDGTAGLAPRDRVAATLAPYLGRLDSMPPTRLPFVSAWFRATGDTARLDSARLRFEALGDSASAQATIAWLALLRADTAGAIERFAALRPVADVGMAAWRFWEPLAAERLQLAELLLRRGRASEALGIAGDFDRPLSINLVFLRPSLELRVRAAEQLGRSALAGELRGRLAAFSRAQ